MNKLSLISIFLRVFSNSAIQFFDRDEDTNCNHIYDIKDTANGTISSLGYPRPYPPRKICTTEFRGDSLHRVLVKFEHFYLFHPQGEEHSRSTSCDGLDTLRVYDGKNEESRLLGVYCGASQPLPVMSSGPDLTLQLTSYTSGINARGYTGTFAFVTDFGITSPFQRKAGNCTFEIKSRNGRSGVISSPNPGGMYPRNTTCMYTFTGSFLEQVLLSFRYFDVEGIDPCTERSGSDYLEFSSLPGFDPCPARRCGRFSPQEVVSEGPYFNVIFKSNDNLDGRGFEATFSFLQKKDLPAWALEDDSGASSFHEYNYGFPLIALIVIKYTFS